jgi:hypothetical protein
VRSPLLKILIYYTTRGLKILDYTRRVARKPHEIVDRVVFPATRRVIEEFSILELYTGRQYHE